MCFSSSSFNLSGFLNLTTASLYLYISGGNAQLTGNHKSLPYLGKMLPYLWEVEISRRLHKSFTITWKILEVMILELLPNTEFISIWPISILKQFYMTYKIFLLWNEYAHIQTKFLLIKLSRWAWHKYVVVDSTNLTFQCHTYILQLYI